MQVKSIAEGCKWSILQYLRPSLSYHLSLISLFCHFLSGRFTQVLLYISRGLRLEFPNKDILQSLKIFFILVNIADPDEMLHSVAFDLGLCSLPKLGRVNSLHAGQFFMPLLSSVDFFSKITFFKIFFQEHYQIIKRSVGS